MKNWKRYLAIALMLCFAVALIPVEAHADVFTAAMIGNIAYGIATASGITFTAGSATAQGMSDFMAGQVENYVNSKGGTLSSLFTGQVAVNAAGKLVVAQTLYNEVRGFLGWLKDKYTIGSTDITLTDGQFDGVFLPADPSGDTFGNYRIQFHSQWPAGSKGYQGFYLFEGERQIASPIYTNTWRYSGSWGINYDNGNLYVVTDVIYYDTGNYIRTDRTLIASPGPLDNSLLWSAPADWSLPQEIPDGKSWVGDFSSTPSWQDAQDVPDFLPQIPEAIANNDINVTGEVLDDEYVDPDEPIDPPPTTAPTYPPIDDVLGGLGEIGGTLDGINDAVGSIDQTLEGVGENVGEIEQTITEALEVPDVEDIELHKFDLKGLFPFCIPFDLHAIISAFSTDPVTPSVSIPFNIPSIGLQYTFNLDLHDFDGLAQILRTLEFIAFGVGLLFVTGKVIKW